MDLVKTCYILAPLILLVSNATAAEPEYNLSYSPSDSYYSNYYESGSAYSELSFQTRTNYDNCTISTVKEFLPSNWKTTEPSFFEPNSTGNYTLETPSITPDNYPENGSVAFTLLCKSSNLTSRITGNLTFNFEENPSLISRYSLDKILYVGVALLILFIGSIYGLRNKDIFRKRKAEKLSQKVIEDLKRRDYTPSEVEDKISRAQTKILNQKYEEAISLLRDANRKLDRT